MKLLVPFPAAFLALLLCGAPLHAQQEGPEQLSPLRFSVYGTIGFGDGPEEGTTLTMLGAGVGMDLSLPASPVFLRAGGSMFFHWSVELGVGVPIGSGWQVGTGIAYMTTSEWLIDRIFEKGPPKAKKFTSVVSSLGTIMLGTFTEFNYYLSIDQFTRTETLPSAATETTFRPATFALKVGWML